MSDTQRINLLPRDVGMARSDQKTIVISMIALGIFVILLAGLYVLKASDVSRVNGELEQQEQVNASIQQEINEPSLQSVLAKKTELDSKKELLTGVLAGEVSYARFLNELSIVTPSRVWLGDLNVTSAAEAEGSTGDPRSQSDVSTLTSETTVAAFTVSGSGFCDHDYSADWLDRMNALPSVAAVWVSDSTTGDCNASGGTGTAGTLSFSSEGLLNSSLLTTRSQRASAGELP